VSLPSAQRLAFLGALLLLSACASWRGTDEATLEAQARADDKRCTEQGTTFPSEAYDHCRRHLAQQRQDKRHREYEMASLQAADLVPNETRNPEGVQRLIDPERFSCEARGEGAARVVFCEERK
jgi:hypothetical protein